MQFEKIRFAPALLAALAIVALPRHVAEAGPPLMSTSYIYQGELKQAGVPVNGTADFQFSLFAAAAGGSALDGPYFVFNVPVVDGKFTASISHAIQHFTGADRYLGIAVRSPAGSGSYTTLSPRQRISPTPYALQTRGIFVNSAGNAGIGAASPVARLHVDDGTDTGLAGGGYLVLGDPTAANLSFDNNELMARNNGAVSTLALNASGGDVNILQNGGGNVGIGTNNAQARLHVVGGNDVSPGSGGQFVIGNVSGPNVAFDNNEIMARNNGGTATLFLNAEGGTVAVGDSAFVNLDVTGNITGTTVFGDFIGAINTNNHATLLGRNGSNGALVQWAQDNTPCGTIAVFNGVVSYNAFTGSHYGWADDQQPLERGMLVSMTGANRWMSAADESEIVYGIVPTAIANDSACLGAYLGLQEPLQPHGDGNPHLIASVGNGELWVLDTGSDLAPGDLLISSHVAGCAMKDDPQRFHVGHIIARAAQRVDWSGVQPDERGLKRARVSVLFDSFVRNAATSDHNDLREENGRLRELVSRQEAALRDLAERVSALEQR